MAVIYMMMCVLNLYEYAKQNSGTLGSTLWTVEVVVMTIVGPVYQKFKAVPDDFLVLLYKKVGETRVHVTMFYIQRLEDVGKPKAEVAAKRVMHIVAGVNIIPHFCTIEDKELDFYSNFSIIALGLDSVEARNYITHFLPCVG